MRCSKETLRDSGTVWVSDLAASCRAGCVLGAVRDMSGGCDKASGFVEFVRRIAEPGVMVVVDDVDGTASDDWEASDKAPPVKSRR